MCDSSFKQAGSYQCLSRLIVLLYRVLMKSIFEIFVIREPVVIELITFVLIKSVFEIVEIRETVVKLSMFKPFDRFTLSCFDEIYF